MRFPHFIHLFFLERLTPPPCLVGAEAAIEREGKARVRPEEKGTGERIKPLPTQIFDVTFGTGG